MCIILINQQKISTLSVQMHGSGSTKNAHAECTNAW